MSNVENPLVVIEYKNGNKKSIYTKKDASGILAPAKVGEVVVSCLEVEDSDGQKFMVNWDEVKCVSFTPVDHPEHPGRRTLPLPGIPA